jgi:hypothetical protein
MVIQIRTNLSIEIFREFLPENIESEGQSSRDVA